MFGGISRLVRGPATLRFFQFKTAKENLKAELVRQGRGPRRLKAMASSSLLWCTLVMCFLTVVQIYGQDRLILKVFNLRASKLNNGIFTTPDAYVKVFLGPSFGGQTEVRNDQKDPWWKEEFGFFDARENSQLRLEVYDSNVLSDKLLGSCERAIRNGTSQHDCFLDKGGTLQYTYTLGPISQNLENHERQHDVDIYSFCDYLRKKFTSRLYRHCVMSSHNLSLGLLFICALSLVHCDPYAGRVRVWGISATNLNGDVLSQPDPYVKVWCGPAFGGMTSVLKNQANPTWPGEFNFLDIIHKSVLKLEVWDDDSGPDDRLGTCTTTIRKGTHIETCHLKKGTLYYTYTYENDTYDQDN
ncbi:hypothetical protein DPEC_G00257980 [Dallia pectoralis]|uniref:Uncharacterized protein n=1 Tax=Dallia pectoralis TaxID=75939 RepID=A0ACC2FR89_DALPE|nr:hypothetical protein DPEC_G00257980 [Dallia pectoralis]